MSHIKTHYSSNMFSNFKAKMSSNGNDLHVDKEVQTDMIFWTPIWKSVSVKNTKIFILLGLKMPFLEDIS